MMRYIVPILAAALVASVAYASSDKEHPKQEEWHFDGVLGTFDKPSIQRGLQVYKEVCASCHSLDLVAFRSLTDVGFSDAEVKSLAATYMVKDGPNDEGEMFERAGKPSDKFPGPYANEQAARAINNGAYPPDLSLIAKSREDGPNYVYSILTGYKEAPAYRCKEVADGACVEFHQISPDEAKEELEKQAAIEESEKELAAEDAKDAKEGEEEEAAPAVKEAQVGDVFYCSDITHEENAEGKTIEGCKELGKTMHYNPYFPGKQIAMPSPLHTEGLVEYQDETKATQDQMAHDVVNFLQWAAEPEMEVRKRMGLRVMIFLAAMTGFFYVAKKRIWSRIGH